MSEKEVVIPHEQISDPQTITPIMQKILTENGMSMKHNLKIEDSADGEDPKGKRIIRTKVGRKFFDMGRGKR